MKHKSKWIIWENPDQRLIRAKKSWGYGNYILEVKQPFVASFTGLTIEEVTASFRLANEQFWKLAETKPAKVFGPKRKKRKK